MNIPLKWIKEYVDIDLDLKSLTDLLTMTGTKVEGITEVGHDLKNIVVGRVTSTSKHPELTKLTIVTLDIGGGKEVVIATAATNVTTGVLVPAVLPGGMVHGGKEIGFADFKGVKSEGMLCSIEELGIGSDANGILILPEDYAPGDDIIEKLGLKDHVIEFEITPNRPDCLCVIGIAREIAAITNKQLKMPDVSFVADSKATDDYLSVDVVADELCMRYSALIIDDVVIKESPLKMQARLHYSGVRAVNNIVDITNYVMLECNQPLHAFDYSAIGDKTIQVRVAQKDEKIVTLDGVERELVADETLLICDSNKAVAIAGVMGGENSEIKDDTHTVVLESALFAKHSIWSTSRKLKLRSESSSRFEKGLDIEGVPFATLRVANLVSSLGIGKITKNPVDVYKKPQAEASIDTKISYINRLLSLNLDNEVEGILVSLGFVVTRKGDDISVVVPSFRSDVRAEIDLVEEIVRVYGFDKVPSIIPNITSLGSFGPSRHKDLIVRRCNTAFGAYEVQTYTLIAPKDLDDLRVPEESSLRSYITLSNPMSQDNSILRTTILPSILKVISTNYNRKNQSINIYEIGKVFFPNEALLNSGKELAKGEEPACEKRVLVGGLAGDANEVSWLEKSRKYDFYDAKGMIERLLDELLIKEYTFVASSHFAMHPGRTCGILVAGESIGTLGEIDVLVANAFDVPERTYIYEIDYEKLVALSSVAEKVKPIPKYPAISRDLAIVADKEVASSDIAFAIRKYGGELVESVKIFDLYEGENLNDDTKKSIAFAVSFRSSDRTLTDEEIIEVQENILKGLKSDFNAILR